MSFDKSYIVIHFDSLTGTPLKWHSVKRQTVRLCVNDAFDRMIPQDILEKNYWTALGSANVLEGEGVKLTNGESYRYQVLSVGAPHPHMKDVEDAKFVVRDCYPKIWEILEPELGRQFTFLLRGPPGIGKSLAFATGYLLYQLRKTMMNGIDLLLTPPSPRCPHHVTITSCMPPPSPRCHRHLHAVTLTTLPSPPACRHPHHVCHHHLHAATLTTLSSPPACRHPHHVVITTCMPPRCRLVI